MTVKRAIVRSLVAAVRGVRPAWLVVAVGHRRAAGVGRHHRPRAGAPPPRRDRRVEVHRSAAPHRPARPQPRARPAGARGRAGRGADAGARSVAAWPGGSSCRSPGGRCSSARVFIDNVDLSDWTLIVESYAERGAQHAAPRPGRRVRRAPDRASSPPRCSTSAPRAAGCIVRDFGSSWGMDAPNLEVEIAKGAEYRGTHALLGRAPSSSSSTSRCGPTSPPPSP